MVTLVRRVREAVRDLLEGPLDPGFCPSCGRWVNLTPVLDDRHCR
jgi:hypothetical protein